MSSFSPIWPQPDRNWNFDVSSLIILIGEELELRYRLSQRSFLQCITAAPVVGLQSYIRSYDLLLEPGALTYSSPYGCKTAPLRNVQLESAIRSNKLLEDGKFNIYKVREKPEKKSPIDRYDIILSVWVAFTWIIYGGLIAFSILIPTVTWIGIANVTVLTGWSIIVRVIEFLNIQPAEARRVGDPGDTDAIYILGRDNSAFVLKGTRMEIKIWTSRGLVYKSVIPGAARLFKGFTRITSLLVLLFIFSTIPNGHTMDQLAFIISNALGQVNVLLGQWLNSQICLSKLEVEKDGDMVDTRTHVYANLIKEFKDANKHDDWVDVLDLLPKTKRWTTWKTRYTADVSQDPKTLFSQTPEGG
jgi:hypothetical protein